MSDSLAPVDPGKIEISDDDLMQFTQRTRKAFIQELITDGFPADPKDRMAMLTAMADMDRTALGNKRIGANERQAAADALVAQAMARFVEANGQNNPFEGNRQGVLPEIRQELLPDDNAVPGETDIGITKESYETLMDYEDE